ncbi:keratin-associated protein 26-1 [Erinaceus europaeus]|uniref:Keratin-associated protein n=1 Tax=Erinaceus europaeus TaxID=9365 RepID=A0A1S3A352_ERIEU|nr:keratin-associated protein 26-1 [Erinaceus europaeus]
MSCSNYCSGNCSMGSLRHPCHTPLPSSMNFCSTDISGGNMVYLPSSCQDPRTWNLDNRQENHGELVNRQPGNCEPSNWENSYYPPIPCYVPRPCQGGNFLPTSYISSSCLPVSSRPLNFVSSSCRPQNVFTYGYRPVSCVPCGPQPLTVVSSSLRPVRPISRGCQPVTHMYNSCRPYCSAFGSQ